MCEHQFWHIGGWDIFQGTQEQQIQYRSILFTIINSLHEVIHYAHTLLKIICTRHFSKYLSFVSVYIYKGRNVSIYWEPFFFGWTQCIKSVLFCYTEFSWNFKLKWHNFENLNHLYFLPDLVLILTSRYIWQHLYLSFLLVYSRINCAYNHFYSVTTVRQRNPCGNFHICIKAEIIFKVSSVSESVSHTCISIAPKVSSLAEFSKGRGLNSVHLWSSAHRESVQLCATKIIRQSC